MEEDEKKINKSPDGKTNNGGDFEKESKAL